jgi:hypothetical protein
MSRYDIREQEPTEAQQQLGVTGMVFVVWDTRWDAPVAFGRYGTREQAQKRIDRMEKR